MAKKQKEVDYLNDKRYSFKLGRVEYQGKSKEEIEHSSMMGKANQRYGGGQQFYTVFRVGDKFKANPMSDGLTIDGLNQFNFHSNRTAKTPKNKLPSNVDPSRVGANKIILGSENVKEDVMAYLEGVKIYKNSVIAREIVLSAGNGFWNKLSDDDRKAWIEINEKFLKQYFGDNCVYAILHMDETTPHIHALIVPVIVNGKGIPTLNNSFYFDGKDKLSSWQDVYTDAMAKRFPGMFKRGIRGSRATHVDLKTYYKLIKEDLKKMESEVILAHAKENFINKKKVEELEDTIKDKDKIIELTNDILKKNRELKDTKKLYEYVIKNLVDKYEIPTQEVEKIISNKPKETEKGRQNER